MQGPAVFQYGYEPAGHPAAGFLRTRESEAGFVALTSAYLAGQCAGLPSVPGTGRSFLFQVGLVLLQLLHSAG